MTAKRAWVAHPQHCLDVVNEVLDGYCRARRDRDDHLRVHFCHLSDELDVVRQQTKKGAVATSGRWDELALMGKVEADIQHNEICATDRSQGVVIHLFHERHFGCTVLELQPIHHRDRRPGGRHVGGAAVPQLEGLGSPHNHHAVHFLGLLWQKSSLVLEQHDALLSYLEGQYAVPQIVEHRNVRVLEAFGPTLGEKLHRAIGMGLRPGLIPHEAVAQL
mmetsp:Transcript_59410/g.150518  ORF Transcript_59410/g.150518 Transcript_59410/m.150518 type:complete len:219 (-) Transcript_59410:886-1542(-)